MLNNQPTVALIQPDSPFLTEPLSFPGLGLLYISSFLKKHGYDPEVYDLTGGVELSHDIQADIFGFSCQVVHFPFVVDAVKQLRHNNPDSIFVIGGPRATWLPQSCINSGLDLVVRGEGELPMLEIVKNYDDIKNKLKNGKNVKREFAQEKYLDADSIPFPDWDAIDIKRYRYQLAGRKCMNIMTNRGNCPFGAGGTCRFCSKTTLGGPLRFRSVENVLEEAKTLRDRYDVGALVIYDNEVMIRKKRDLKIFKGLKQLDMKFRCMTRSNLEQRGAP